MKGFPVMAKNTVSAERLVLDNGLVRAVFQLHSGTTSEQYFSLTGGPPILIAESVPGSGLAACLLAAEEDNGARSNVVPDYRNKPHAEWGTVYQTDGPVEPVGDAAPTRVVAFDRYERSEGKVSQLTFHARTTAGDELQRTVSLEEDTGYFKITNSLRVSQPLAVEYLTDRYRFSPGPDPDFTWMPQLKKDSTCVNADWALKSPALIIQKGQQALALVPDVTSLPKEVLEKCNLGLDLDVTAESKPVLTCGFIPSVPHYHSLFVHPEGLRAILAPGTISFTYYLLPFVDVPERQVYRQVVRFLWRTCGHDNLVRGHATQGKPFGAWEKYVWHGVATSPDPWIEFDYEGEQCGGMRLPNGWYSKSIWFYGWFNALRTAYGLERYGRRGGYLEDIHGKMENHQRAPSTLNLALKAPRRGGAFPIIFDLDSGSPRWQMGCGFAGFADCYNVFHMSWTSYWLLKWLQDLVPDDGRILPRCADYGDFLLKIQRDSGLIPSFVEEDLTTVRSEIGLNQVNAEAGVSAAFLIELYKVTGEGKYREAAVRAISYVERAILPESKWFDYETFLSCSPTPYDFYDPITRQYPQNNMSVIQVARACLLLHEVTQEEHYLDLGTLVLDYLSLTQQVWSHPRLTPDLIGGFTTQNTDAEWSDARQSYCAVLYFDYFERTGRLEYLERGVAALRATFAVSPFENWSHLGFEDQPGDLCGPDWGVGAAMSSVEMVWERYGDVLVDLEGKWACGINGCSATDLSLGDGQIDLRIVSTLRWQAPLRVVFRNGLSGRYRLSLNGKAAGEFESEDLLKGILINTQSIGMV